MSDKQKQRRDRISPDRLRGPIAGLALLGVLGAVAGTAAFRGYQDRGAGALGSDTVAAGETNQGYLSADDVARYDFSIDRTLLDGVVIDGESTPAVVVKAAETPNPDSPVGLGLVQSKIDLAVSVLNGSHVDLTGFERVAPDAINPQYKPVNGTERTIVVPLPAGDGLYSITLKPEVSSIHGSQFDTGTGDELLVLVENGEVASEDATLKKFSNDVVFYDPSRG